MQSGWMVGGWMLGGWMLDAEGLDAGWVGVGWVQRSMKCCLCEVTMSVVSAVKRP